MAPDIRRGIYRLTGDFSGSVHMTLKSDEDLMLAYREGDAAAFDELYRRHRPRLYRFLAHEAGSSAIGEELYQEAWLRVINARARYQPTARFTTWLYTVAHNVLLDYFRRRGRLSRFEETREELPDAPACPRQEPETVCADAWQASRLRDCLEGLPEEQREAFLLKEQGDFGLDEIAAITGTGAETIKSRVRYAIRKLRQCLEGLL